MQFSYCLKYNNICVHIALKAGAYNFKLVMK